MGVTLIYSSNRNPVYARFSILQEEACRHLGLKTFFCQSGAETWSLREDGADLPPIEGVPDVFISQVARYILPAFFPEREFLVGDIDMLILSRKHAQRVSSRIRSHDGLLLIDSDTYHNLLRYPCCYYGGKGKVFAEVLGLKDPSWEGDVVPLIRDIWGRGDGWTGDEYYFSEAAQLASKRVSVAHFNERVSTPFGRRGKLKGRINRSDWRFNRLGLFTESYIDAHCVRPIEENIDRLRHVFNYLYSGLDGRRYMMFELSRFLRGTPDLFPESFKKP